MMVLPSENLHAALAGGLSGALGLSCPMPICAEARVATANSDTAIKANFLMTCSSLEQSAVSQFRTESGSAECCVPPRIILTGSAECGMLSAFRPHPLQSVHDRVQRQAGRTRALRTAHGRAPRAAGGHHGPGQRRHGPGGAAWRLLPEPALAGQAG